MLSSLLLLGSPRRRLFHVDDSNDNNENNDGGGAMTDGEGRGRQAVDLTNHHSPRSTSSSADDYDDDASEITHRSNSGSTNGYFSTSTSRAGTASGGGAIRMEGWLNHTTSSQKSNNTPPVAPPPITTASTSMLSKTVSKTKRQSKTSITKKKKQPRYFVLRGSTLSYYAHRHDIKAKGTFVLTRGCTVGPVIFGSLDDSPCSMIVVTNNNCTELSAKKRQLYCVQLTWSSNNNPSKTEQIIAQAKAQVAAESEKEAMMEQQQQQQLQLTGGDHRKSLLLTNSVGGGGSSRSPPRPIPKQLVRRSKSESAGNSDIVTPSAAMHDNGNNGDNNIGDEGGLHTSTASIFRGTSQQDKQSQQKQTLTLADPYIAEAGPQKHYKYQIEKHTREERKSAEETQKVKELLNRHDTVERTRKRLIQGAKVAGVGTAAVTAGLFTAGVAPVVGFVVLGLTAAVGGSGAVAGARVYNKAAKRYNEQKAQKSFSLLIGAATYEEAMKWKVAMEYVIMELDAEEVDNDEETRGIIGTQVRSFDELHEGNDGGGGTHAATTVMMSPGGIVARNGGTAVMNKNIGGHDNKMLHDVTPRWVPIQGGGMALWGILGALGGGGGNLRIYREELSSICPNQSINSPPWLQLLSQPTKVIMMLPILTSLILYMRVFSWAVNIVCFLLSIFFLFLRLGQAPSNFPRIPKIGLGLSGQPFPPFKSSVILKSTSLDAFMCLMCSGRIHSDDESNNSIGTGSVGIPLPNSGQIASFRILETIDDHMDVIHLVFRPLYLFPSWAQPRDFVLFRFWKYDDDGTYQICYDSGEHRDCPTIQGYVRGEMHCVYTIAPLKWKKKRGSADGGSLVGATPSSACSNIVGRPNLMNEECLMSLVVQIDPKGRVPTTSYIPVFRNQGYGDAFAIMALHQMLDVKESLDLMRFVAVNTSFDEPNSGGRRWKHAQRILANGTTFNGGFHKGDNSIQVRKTGVGAARGRVVQQMPYLPAMCESYLADSDEDVDDDFKYSSVQMLNSSDRTPNIKNGVNIQPRIGGVRLDGNNRSRKSDLTLISTIPPPTVIDWWGEPESKSFRVRGKSYKTDNTKVTAGPSIFRLFAADIVEVDVCIMTGMCTHPRERVQLALQREREAKSIGGTASSSDDMPAFVFVVNIAMPGPPNYHMVFYFAVDDISTIDGSDGTPSSKLCNEFFFGNDNTFRDNTFKLIPQIKKGNFMVRKAVGSTPAIMGNKIKQTYFQSERYFELMIDTGSSAVAAGVIRICNGYARTLVVDLAFLFEGYNEETLPERILGTVTLKNVEFGKKMRFVESMDDVSV